jgi:DUF4097 and DUF4098 domain-containing protein YvlB
MKIKKQTILGLTFLIALSALPLASSFASGKQIGRVSRTVSQTYPLSPTGRVSLENLNGDVRVVAWDRDEVMIEAVKRASSQERLDEVQIDIAADADSIRVKTQYPRRATKWADDEGRYNNPASVTYTLSVPRQARIAKIELINGALDIEGVAGEVQASSINGRVMARQLTGPVNLSTVNGTLEATFERFSESQQVSLSSVNGTVVLLVPAGASANLKADTVHGGIQNTFGFAVKEGTHVGRHLSGVLGEGSASIKLGNVNGSISIRN